MGTNKINKTKPKNWEVGDTFAIKIENTNKEYDGRYLILNKVESPFEIGKNDHIFRAKITKINQIPTMKDIASLEYIKTGDIHYYERYLPLKGEESYEECVKRKASIKFYPDENNYLYTQYIEFVTKSKDIFDEFIFIGNGQLKPPIGDYINQETTTPILVTDKKYYIKDLIKSYDDYNMKKSIIYDEKQKKIIEHNVKLGMLPIYLAHGIPIEMLKQHKYDEEKDKYYYHETYVGKKEDND